MIVNISQRFCKDFGHFFTTNLNFNIFFDTLNYFDLVVRSCYVKLILPCCLRGPDIPVPGKESIFE